MHRSLSIKLLFLLSTIFCETVSQSCVKLITTYQTNKWTLSLHVRRFTSVNFIPTKITTMNNCFSTSSFLYGGNILAILYIPARQECKVVSAVLMDSSNTAAKESYSTSKGLIININENMNSVLTSVGVFTNKMTMQQRLIGNVSFEKTWLEYEKGFGELNGDRWVGLRYIREWTMDRPKRIRFEMKKFGDDTWYVAEYSSFKVGPSSDKYRLSVSGYDGGVSTAGDAMLSTTVGRSGNNQRFTSIDKDYDKAGFSCSVFGGNGSWWYNRCMDANPNGRWMTSRVQGWPYIVWKQLDGAHSLSKFKIILYP